MSQEKTDTRPEQAMIRFGGKWISTQEVCNKVEIANAVADAIERFNSNFPQLSNADTRDVVSRVRQRLKEAEMRIPGEKRHLDLGPLAAQLMDSVSPEAVIELLAEKHDAQLNIWQLIQLVGEEHYVKVLRREAGEYRLNRISAEQTARLWNDLPRPVPGGGLWTDNKIEALLDGNA